jgi:hypothetical protein
MDVNEKSKAYGAVRKAQLPASSFQTTADSFELSASSFQL